MMKPILKQRRKTVGWYQQRSMENVISFKAKEQAFYSKHITPCQKLYFLQKRYPDNSFYKSLYGLVGKVSFSAKQLDCIDRDYLKFFTEDERVKHLLIDYSKRGKSSNL